MVDKLDRTFPVGRKKDRNGAGDCMTTESLADTLKARRTGRLKWLARCPAHEDRSPSLSITEGRDGRVLVHCFAGCKPEAVLKAVGLTFADLKPTSTPLSSSERAQLAREREQHEAAEQEGKQKERVTIDRIRRLEAIEEALMDKLVCMPIGEETNAVARLYHHALDLRRKTEESWEKMKARR